MEVRTALETALEHEVCEPFEQILDVQRVEEIALVLLIGMKSHGTAAR
jgi:hypothetical protein